MRVSESGSTSGDRPKPGPFPPAADPVSQHYVVFGLLSAPAQAAAATHGSPGAAAVPAGAGAAAGAAGSGSALRGACESGPRWCDAAATAAARVGRRAADTPPGSGPRGA